jgi:hypothetical protein
MGQTQSGVISVEEFSERIMGAAVVLLSGQLDKSLTFKPVDQIQVTDKHVLPILTNTPETYPSMALLNSLYAQYYTEEKKLHINRYIEEHILDTEEHLNGFTSLLINSLSRRSGANYYVTEGKGQKAGANESDQQSVARSVTQKSVGARSAGQKSVAARSVAQSVTRSVAPSIAPSIAQQSAPRPVTKQSVAARSVAPEVEVEVEGEPEVEAEPEPEVPADHQTIQEAQEVVQSIVITDTDSAQAPLKVSPTSEVHTSILSSLEAPPRNPNVLTRIEALRPVKGSNKLQKRMHAIDQAIDAERIAQKRLEEAKSNIAASYQEESSSTIAAADAIADEAIPHPHEGDSSDEFEHINH